MAIVVVDYGMGNLGSVRRALEECGGRPLVTSRVDALEAATGVVLPGVGAFADGMANLDAGGWCSPLRRIAEEERIPVLGICLGMQLLADHGREGGDTAGLGIIPGDVTLMEPSVGERIPHIGWNEVTFSDGAAKQPLLNGLCDNLDFYFVHSFAFRPTSSSDVLATTPHGGGVPSVVARGRVVGVQFHPEKSASAGLRLLRNFVELAAGRC